MTGEVRGRGFHLRLEAHLVRGAHTLDLSLETRSRRVAIDGPSGAGKTTLLRILAGLEPRARARVEVDEEVWQDGVAGVHRPPWERSVGWVPQDALLFPHRTVAANLSYAGASPDAVTEMARRLRIDGLLDRRPRNLSGGEAQRVALGRALLARPRLLLLDEPFAALDGPLRDELADTLVRHCEAEGLPFLLVSHDSATSERIAQEHWTLTDGRLRLREPCGSR